MAKKAKSLVAARPDVPVAAFATILGGICADIDNGKAITVAVKDRFAVAAEGFKESVDQHVQFHTFVEGLALAAKNAKALWEKRRKTLQGVLDAFEAEVKGAIEAEPNLPWQSGSLGGFAIHKNPGALDMTFAVTNETFRNVIDDETIAMFGIEDEFIVTHTVKTLMPLDDIKALLKDGRKLAWASIHQDTKLAVVTN